MNHDEERLASCEDIVGLRTIMQKGLVHLNSILLRRRRMLRQAEDDAVKQRMEYEITAIHEQIACFSSFMESMIQRIAR